MIGSETYTKESVEAIPLGQWDLSISGRIISWAEQDRAKQLSDTITAVMQSVDDLGIGAARILRLIVVTSDYQEETTKWAQQLGRGTPSDLAVGQTLSWGTGEPKSTYSIIILAERIAGLVLLEDDLECRSLAVRCLTHELAHVHDDFRYLCTFGPDKPPEQNDWVSIRRFVAKSTWSEFFAESVAVSYTKSDSLDDDISLGIALLLDAHREIQGAIVANSQSPEGLGKVWDVAVDKLSGAFNQLGRSLGILTVDQCDSREREQFFQSVGEVLPNWETITCQLADELDVLANQEQWDPMSFSGLEAVIEQGFRATGVHPKSTKSGLWIDTYRMPHR